MATRLLTTQRIVNLSSDPVSANSGEVYFNTSSNIFRNYKMKKRGGGDNKRNKKQFYKQQF
jgi:hypothetical protein